MDTHPPSDSRSAGLLPLCIALLVGGLPLFGCGQPDDPEPQRPSIEVTESRCNTVELVGLRRADRLAVSEDGRIALAGSRVDEEGYEAGRVFELDPRSGAAQVFDSAAPHTVVAWLDGAAYTDRGGRLAPADPEDTAQRPLALPDGMPTNVIGSAPDAYVEGDSIWVSTHVRDALRPRAIVRLTAHGAGARVDAQYGTLGARLGDDWLDATPKVRAFVPGPDDRVYAVGRARAASVEHADLRPSDRPRVDLGFVSVARATRPPVGENDIAFRAVEHAVTVWPQAAFWPMRVVLDHRQRPTVLYITGHSGKRITDGWPHMARIAPTGALVDPRPLPLPAFAQHGGIQAALPLADGGWLIGGSACRPGRSICKGFVSRIDRDLETTWTAYVVRETASTVVDLQRIGDRIYALGVSSPYCCEYDTYRNGGWLVEVMDDGACPDAPTLPADGRWLR